MDHFWSTSLQYLTRHSRGDFFPSQVNQQYLDNGFCTQLSIIKSTGRNRHEGPFLAIFSSQPPHGLSSGNFFLPALINEISVMHYQLSSRRPQRREETRRLRVHFDGVVRPSPRHIFKYRRKIKVRKLLWSARKMTNCRTGYNYTHRSLYARA